MELILLFVMALGSATFMSTGTSDPTEGEMADEEDLGDDMGEEGGFANADGDPLTGDQRNDRIAGTEEDDDILGRKGDDILQGRGGDDTIGGGAGNDRIDGEDGDDSLHGDAGNDRLIGGEGDDSLDGGVGFDRLEGRWGNDSLIGGDGNDTLEGQQGDDTLEGGDGNDTLILNGKDTARGDEGRDEFRLQTSEDRDRMVVEDYTPEDDRIVVEYDGGQPEPTVAVTQSGEDAFVTLNGERVAEIRGAADTLTVADIALVAAES